MNLSFQINTEGDLTIYQLKGKINSDMDTVPFNESLNAFFERNTKALLIDLSGVSQMNSSGLNILVKSLTRSRIRNCKFALSYAEGNVKKLIEIAKMDRVFTIYNKIEQAINDLK